MFGEEVGPRWRFQSKLSETDCVQSQKSVSNEQDMLQGAGGIGKGTGER